MIALLLEEMMESLGISVAARAETLDEAREAAGEEGFDAAILDVNLRGHMSYPAAEVLTRRGVPIFFVSGFLHEGVPPHLSNVPVITKPYHREQIASALARVLGLR